jgi:hypothetical protein
MSLFTSLLLADAFEKGGPGSGQLPGSASAAAARASERAIDKSSHKRAAKLHTRAATAHLQAAVHVGGTLSEKGREHLAAYDTHHNAALEHWLRAGK